MRTFIVVILAFLSSSCAQKYALDAFQPPSQRLARNSAIYVMVPENGRYGNRIYPNSGQETAQALFTSLSRITNKIEIGSTTESMDSALTTARSDGAAYIFQPMILNWVDHATEWSGIPDRITIKLIVYDVENGKDVASIMARSSSKWATFGGDHPQDLLPRVMNEFTGQLF